MLRLHAVKELTHPEDVAGVGPTPAARAALERLRVVTEKVVDGVLEELAKRNRLALQGVPGSMAPNLGAKLKLTMPATLWHPLPDRHNPDLQSARDALRAFADELRATLTAG